MAQILVFNTMLRQILSTLTELYDEKSLNKIIVYSFPRNQIISFKPSSKSLEQNSETPLQWSDEFDFPRNQKTFQKSISCGY